LSRWFRFYADALRNSKVARLADKDFRLWVELLAVAADDEGKIPCLDDLKHVLKRRLDHLSTGVERLISMGLIDHLGDGYEPHNWSKFQYKSDTSTERVAKHRAGRNVSVTAPETEAEADKSVVAKATPPTRAKADKGSRISAAWLPAPLPPNVSELVSQWPEGRLAREIEGFRDYWRSRSRDAARTDWDITWHNRIRDIHDRVIRDNKNGRPQQRNGFSQQGSTRDLGAEVAAEFARSASHRPPNDLPRIGPPGRVYG
jgi:hypothetical protein